MHPVARPCRATGRKLASLLGVRVDGMIGDLAPVAEPARAADSAIAAGTTIR
jgi:hypothetical protein